MQTTLEFLHSKLLRNLFHREYMIFLLDLSGVLGMWFETQNTIWPLGGDLYPLLYYELPTKLLNKI